MISAYPEGSQDRDRWIVAKRPPRNEIDPQRPYAFFVEQERSDSGEVIPVAAIFLTNRECPWRCLMCDLWQNTLTWSVPPGAIPAQIDYALSRLPASREIKLYNSGSFFDPQAIPLEDYESIAARLHCFDRVIVESHPALVNTACLRFRDLLREQGDIRLEVAMGLETVHAGILERLNKRMTLEQFAPASDILRKNEIALRVFVLVKPPFLDESEAQYWAERSVDFAFDCGATVVSLIPARPGNGALEALAESGNFSPPNATALEASLDYGISLGRGRVFADLWNLRQFSKCDLCFPARSARLQDMNLRQTVLPPVQCESCRETSASSF